MLHYLANSFRGKKANSRKPKENSWKVLEHCLADGYAWSLTENGVSGSL